MIQNDTTLSDAFCKYPPGLYLVSTPIGHLGDMTVRATETLKKVDLIACEDTRVSRVLLTHYGISTPLTPYHDHSSLAATGKIVDILAAGGRVALIADAGTPLIADPGYPLVRYAIDQAIPVYGVPGPCAAILALALSGFGQSTFFFGGFLPAKNEARRQKLCAYGAVPGTLIFYESPHRLLATLKDIRETLGNGQVALARELTKRYEEVERGSVEELIDRYGQKTPRGEYVVLIGPRPDDPPDDGRGDGLSLLRSYLTAGDSVKAAVTKTVQRTGESKKPLYAAALTIIQDLDRDESRHGGA